jgi:hypothetical protein
MKKMAWVYLTAAFLMPAFTAFGQQVALGLSYPSHDDRHHDNDHDHDHHGNVQTNGSWKDHDHDQDRRHWDPSWRYRHPYGFHQHRYWRPNYGYVSPIYVMPPRIFPTGYVPIGIEGQAYYYRDGMFYQEASNQLVIVPPPTGAIVSNIPTGHTTINVGGVTYHIYNNVFYKRVGGGYQVVDPPVEEEELVGRD